MMDSPLLGGLVFLFLTGATLCALALEFAR